jgi:hypothetical protein
MDKISPSPAARIAPPSSGDKKGSADPRLRKNSKATKPTEKKSSAPPEIEIAERDEKHALDERA